MDTWTKSKDLPLHDFFREITTIEATNVFKMGRISPWVIYLADSATELLNEFNDEQFGMIESKIDPKFWQQKMVTNKEDVSFAKEILGATGL